MDKGELLHTINDLESIAAKRQHKVLQLEAQVRARTMIITEAYWLHDLIGDA